MLSVIIYNNTVFSKTYYNLQLQSNVMYYYTKLPKN